MTTTPDGGPPKRRQPPARPTPAPVRASAKPTAKPKAAPKAKAMPKPKVPTRAKAPAAKAAAPRVRRAPARPTPPPVAPRAPRSTAASRRRPTPAGPTSRRATTGDRPDRSRRRSHGRLLGALLVSIVFVGFLLVAVFPTRTYFQQRAATRGAVQQLQELHAKNAALHTQIKRLQTPAEIERVARKEYGMVRKGEEAYAILPSPPPPVRLPDVWPFTGVAALLNR